MLARAYGWGPEVVSAMTPDQQLMYFTKAQGGAQVVECGSIQEARELMAMLKGQRQ